MPGGNLRVRVSSRAGLVVLLPPSRLLLLGGTNVLRRIGHLLLLQEVVSFPLLRWGLSAGYQRRVHSLQDQARRKRICHTAAAAAAVPPPLRRVFSSSSNSGGPLF